jgi:transcriptional regulator with XRE-family HTH domain
MTPFGERMRQLRDERGQSLKEVAESIGVSPSYLSALERGKRGKPSWVTMQRVLAHFNIIWDEAEQLQELAGISRPRITIDTAQTSPLAVRVANRLAKEIRLLTQEDLAAILSIMEQRAQALKSGNQP